MKISHIEHLGIAVKSIEEALPYYENILGLTCYNIETVEDQKVKTAFLKVGEVKIELLEPTSPDSPIAKSCPSGSAKSTVPTSASDKANLCFMSAILHAHAENTMPCMKNIVPTATR